MSPDASLIREILARECDTVNQYEVLASRAQDPTTRELILHLAMEEKEHIAECALYLATLDAEYADMLDKSMDHVSQEIGAKIGRLPGAAPVQPQTAHLKTEAPAKSGFTVGSLIERTQKEKKLR